MRAIGVLVAIVMSSAPIWADTTTDNKALADKLFLEGRNLLETDPAGACGKFLEALEAEKLNVAILLNLGLCNEKQNKNATALKWYRRTQTVASEKNDPALKEYEDAAKERTTDLVNKVSKVTFSFAPGFQAEAEILIDGQAIDRAELIVEVDQGTHVIEARAPGMTPSRTELVVEDNTKSLTHTFEPLQLAPVSAGSRNRRRLIGALVGGGIIAATTAVSGILAKQNQDKKGADAPTNQNIPTSIFVGGIVVGVGVAAYFWFTSPKRETRQMAVTPVVGGDQLGLAVFRRF